MGSAEMTTVIQEAGGITSALDVEIFRAWKKALPTYTWYRAEVDRFDGLTLFEQTGGYEFALHFAHAVCGYEGTGPAATMTILLEAGFGTPKELEHKVIGRQRASFIK